MPSKPEKWESSVWNTPKVTWLAKYSEWVSWKVPVAGATYTSLILLLYNTQLHIYTCLYRLQSTIYSYSRTSVLYLLRTLSLLVYIQIQVYAVFFFTEVRVLCTCTSTCARTHIRLMYWKFHSPYPSQMSDTYIVHVHCTIVSLQY